jgi:hypothetical protein
MSRLLSLGVASLLAAVLLLTGSVAAVPSVAAVSPAYDRERMWYDHCMAWERVTTPNRACVYGNLSSSRVIALVGDSHASHLFPALGRIVRARGWKLVVMVKVSCGFADMRIRNLALGREYTECATWNRNVIKRLGVLRPALTVVAMSRRALHAVRVADRSNTAKGLAVGRMIERVPGPVALVVDAPYAGRDIPSCIARWGASRCAIPKSTALSYSLGAIERVAAAHSHAGTIDLTRAACAAWPCPVRVQGITVFRDREHFTATFARSILGARGGVLDRALVLRLP